MANIPQTKSEGEMYSTLAVRIPEDLHVQVRAQCALKRVEIREFVTVALHEAISRSKKELELANAR